MESLLTHVYDYAELYTVCLSWLTIPLGFAAVYLRFMREEEQVEDGVH